MYQLAIIKFVDMDMSARIKIKELKVGAKFKMAPNERDVLVINELDSEVAYCTHFMGIYVLPLERYVYKVA